MTESTNDGRSVIGGSANPVYITNQDFFLLKNQVDEIERYLHAVVSEGHVLTDVSQDVIEIPENSSTTNLAAGNSYTFTGTSASTLGVNAIQVSLFADKNCIVKIQQSSDETNWDLEDTRYYTASTKSYGETIQAIKSYFRVVVTTASETTTVFRLQSVLCPIVEAVPRSLDVNGSLKVSLQKDAWGNQVLNSRHGELQTVQHTRLIGSVFDTTLDTNFWTASVSTGTVAVSGSEAVITSGTANGHYARLYSVRRARFVSGMNNQMRVYVRLADTGTANVKRRWGVAYGATMPTITDGAYFELDGTTFSIVTLRGTNETRVSSGSFNGQYGYTYTPTTNNTTYEILYYNSGVVFAVNGIVLHTVNAASATWTNSLGLYCWADASNSGNSAAVAMYIRSFCIVRIGALVTQPTSYYFASGQTAGINLKLGLGNLHSLIINNVTNNAVITLSDSITAATPAIFVHTAGATSTSAYALDMKGLPFYTGLRLTVATANASVTVIYE